MEAPLTPQLQTIQLSSAGRSAVLARVLAVDDRLASAIDEWIVRLEQLAVSFEIAVEPRDVRTLLYDPIDSLGNVFKKIHPRELCGFGVLGTLE